MRHIGWILAMVLASIGAVQAQESFSDPKALVQSIYDGYRPGQLIGDPSIYYSKRLLAVFQLAQDNAAFIRASSGSHSDLANDPIFNPFLPDDSALLFDLTIGEPVILDDYAMVTVTYHNFDQPRLLTVSLVKEGESWKVDDVASLGAEVPWLLSWALTADPYAM